MVPEAMAYDGIVGVPPIMGLYSIVPPLVAYERALGSAGDVAAKNSSPCSA
jgi:MFS superfamily sulfate permease-like transporter